MGKTAHVDNTLDPVWNSEIFVIEIGTQGLNSLGQSTLRIVCLDIDRYGNGNVLGQIELQGWQVEELAQSVRADEVVCSRGEGVLPEADAERIQDFIRSFQKHELGQDGIGKLVVRVPQDPVLLEPREAEAAEEVAEFVGHPFEPRKNSCDNTQEEEKRARGKKRPTHDTRTRSQVDRMLMSVRSEGQEEGNGGNAVENADTDATKHSGQEKEEREIEIAKDFARGGQQAADAEFGLVAAGSSRQHPQKMDGVTAPWESKAGGTEAKEMESGYKTTGDSLHLDPGKLKRTRTDEASSLGPRPLAHKDDAVGDTKGDGNSIDVGDRAHRPQRTGLSELDSGIGSMVMVDVRDTEGTNPLTEVCPEHVKPLEPGQENIPSLSLEPMVQDPLEPTGVADLEAGRGKAERAKSEENRPFSRNGGVRNDMTVRYRDGETLCRDVGAMAPYLHSYGTRTSFL